MVLSRSAKLDGKERLDNYPFSFSNILKSDTFWLMPIGYRTGNIVFVPSNIIILSCLQRLFRS